MKIINTLSIIIGVVLSVFLIIQLLIVNNQKYIETYPFELVKRYDGFEIRSYEASLFTSVTLSSNEYTKASTSGFPILAGYIFGGNETNEKIPMTAPVKVALEDSMTMMFMIPRNITKEQLPKPHQSEIQFREEPAKTVAAISFGGWADDETINNYKNQLIESLDKNGIEHANRFYFLGYNAPYEVFNRRNEIIVELKQDKVTE